MFLGFRRCTGVEQICRLTEMRALSSFDNLLTTQNFQRTGRTSMNNVNSGMSAIGGFNDVNFHLFSSGVKLPSWRIGEHSAFVQAGPIRKIGHASDISFGLLAQKAYVFSSHSFESYNDASV